MSLATQLTDLGGYCPVLEKYVFVTNAGTATIDVDVVDQDGDTIAQVTLSVSTSPKTAYELIVAQSVAWLPNTSRKPVGMRVTEVATADVYWNTSGTLTSNADNTYTAGYAVAPTLARSAKLAIGVYSGNLWLVGRVFG